MGDECSKTGGFANEIRQARDVILPDINEKHANVVEKHADVVEKHADVVEKQQMTYADSRKAEAWKMTAESIADEATNADVQLYTWDEASDTFSSVGMGIYSARHWGEMLPVLGGYSGMPYVNDIAGLSLLNTTTTTTAYVKSDDLGNGAVYNYSATDGWKRELEYRRDFHQKYDIDLLNQTAYTTLVDNGQYDTFPIISDNKKGIILTTFGAQLGHTGATPADIRCVRSLDGGTTWENEVVIAGNLTGTETTLVYWHAAGCDSKGRFVVVFGKTIGTSQRPFITYSEDGLIWTTPIECTFTGEAGGNLGSLPMFATIHTLPSGKLGLAFYKGADNYIGILDPKVSESHFNLTTVFSSADTFSEAAFLPVSESHWLYLARHDGSANGPVLWTTTDGGLTWNTLGDMYTSSATDEMPRFGYLPQDLKTVTFDDGQYVIFAVAVRETISLPQPDAPAIKFFCAEVSSIFAGTAEWLDLKTIPLVNQGGVATRDAYVNFIVNEARELQFVGNEETTDITSKVIRGGFMVEKPKRPQGFETDKIRADLLLVGSTGGTANVYNGPPLLYYTKQGHMVYVMGTISVTTLNQTGNLSIEGFPFTFDLAYSFIEANATGVNSGGKISLVAQAGTNVIELRDLEGASFLTDLEVTAPLTIKFSGMFYVNEI